MIKDLLYLFVQIERPIKRAIQIFLDTFFIFFSIYLSLLLRLGKEFDIQWFTNAIQVVYITLPITLLAFIKLGHYRSIVRYISTKAFKVIVIGVLISTSSIYLSSILLSINI